MKLKTIIASSLLLASSYTTAIAKDFGNFSVDVEIGGAQDGWNQVGSDLNSARFTGYALLDIGYKFNDQISILLENAVVEVDDGVHTKLYTHDLTLTYEVNGFDLNVGASVTDTDEDRHSEGNQQESYALYEVGYTTSEHGIRFAVEFQDELSDGSVSGSNRYADEIIGYKIEKTFDAPMGIGKNLVVELNYWDANNLRDVISLDLELNMTDNFGVGLLVGENDGKGSFANSVSQNRDFAAVRAFVKY
jgi:hypothetical protein